MEAKVDWEESSITYRGHKTLVRPFPISIDAKQIAQMAKAPKVTAAAKRIPQEIDPTYEILALGIDRVDYTKGLMEKVQNHTPQGAAATASPYVKSNFLVMDVLRAGKENAISAQELCEYLGLNSVRELQHIICRERKAGAVILSTCQEGGGYFLPGNDREDRQFIRTLENRAKNTFEALHSARSFLQQHEHYSGE